MIEHHALTSAPHDLVAEPLQEHHAEGIERLRQRHERFQVDRRHGHRRVARLGRSIVIAKQCDRFLSQHSRQGTDRRLPDRCRVLDRRRHHLLPALQEVRIRPVRQCAAGLRRTRLEADEQVERPAKLVGDLHELHRVHVARQHDEPPRRVRREGRLQRRAELVQLNGVVGCAIVANREQPRGVERRASDHRIAVHDAQTRHHQDIAARRTGIESPQQELLERFRIAAVDSAEQLRLGGLAMPESNTLGAGFQIEIDRDRHRQTATNLRQFLERRNKRVFLPRPVVVPAEKEQRGPFRRGVGL